MRLQMAMLASTERPSQLAALPTMLAAIKQRIMTVLSDHSARPIGSSMCSLSLDEPKLALPARDARNAPPLDA